MQRWRRFDVDIHRNSVGSRSTKRCQFGLRERAGALSKPELARSEEHTSELQSRLHLVCRLLLEKKKHQVSSPQSQLTGGRPPHSHIVDRQRTLLIRFPTFSMRHRKKKKPRRTSVLCQLFVRVT